MSEDILVEVFGAGAPSDPEELDRITRGLRRELLELQEVAQVAAATAGPAPPGTRGLDVAAIGALAVTVKPTIEVLEKVFGMLRAWMGSRHSSETPQSTLRVTVNGQTIELIPTEEQQAALVAAFIAQSATPPTS
ncbi:conserved hypothetical protein [metagenome]|uniref:Uncharacterized protein n=1 Tax=metagenome TaxID=256318 RepID=A0A2P2BZV6_9ZZZZ